MNKTLKLAFVTLAVVVGHAQASTPATPDLLSIDYVTVGRTAVALPTVKNADGVICKSYIAGSSSAEDGFVETSVKQICGPANAEGTAPAKLVSLKNFESKGLMVQLATIRPDVTR